MTFDNQRNDAVTDTVPPNCQCETCKLRRFEDSAIRDAVVHNYSYNPRRWNLNAVRNDPFDYYLGVELETDNYRLDANGDRVRARVTNRQAVSMARPARLWLAKADGSVSGPEFVSHPATLTYWHSKADKLAEMFRMLVHGGMRSHDNNKAGMHISISKNAFEDQRHLFRFLTLIHGNAEWSLKMSQRTRSSAEQWASINYLADDAMREEEVIRIMPTEEQRRTRGYYQLGSSHRYQAINCPSGGIHSAGRFEFRLPRGTLRLDRFFKNLEWTVAMIEYTRNTLVEHQKANLFMRWVLSKDQREQYPNLAKFLTERFDDMIIVADDLIPAGFGPDMVVTPVRPRARTATPVAAAQPEATDPGVRISPRTGRPVRQYNRRPGARRPGRPTGWSPNRDRTAISLADLPF